jgi:hypothetical protein
MCYVCGKVLADAMGRTVDGVAREVDGNRVRVHKVCAKTFDRDAARTLHAMPGYLVSVACTFCGAFHTEAEPCTPRTHWRD